MEQPRPVSLGFSLKNKIPTQSVYSYSKRLIEMPERSSSIFFCLIQFCLLALHFVASSTLWSWIFFLHCVHQLPSSSNFSKNQFRVEQPRRVSLGYSLKMIPLKYPYSNRKSQIEMTERSRSFFLSYTVFSTCSTFCGGEHSLELELYSVVYISSVGWAILRKNILGGSRSTIRWKISQFGRLTFTGRDWSKWLRGEAGFFIPSDNLLSYCSKFCLVEHSLKLELYSMLCTLATSVECLFFKQEPIYDWIA